MGTHPYRGGKGGGEFFRSESLELRHGDRVRVTRNDPASGLTNGQVAAVESVEKDGVGFRLEDGSPMKLGEGDPQIRHLDRAWAATIHAFQGRTVERIVAVMPSGNVNLVNQMSVYVAISRARDRADLVTDDPKRLADQRARATGERVAALDALAKQAALEAGTERGLTFETSGGRPWALTMRRTGDTRLNGLRTAGTGASPGPAMRSSADARGSPRIRPGNRLGSLPIPADASAPGSHRPDLVLLRSIAGRI